MVVISFDIGIINLAVCVFKDGNPIILKLVNLFERCPKHIPIDRLSESIYLNLDILMNDIREANGPDTVVENVLLENQPSRVNGKMKTVQMLIYSYFYNLKYYEHAVKGIHMVNATLKLQEYNLPRLADRRDSYKQNKQASIEICLDRYKDNPYIYEVIKGSNKKDDLCDALLQGLAWIKKNGKQGGGCG